jgi:hypothetical protein
VQGWFGKARAVRDDCDQHVIACFRLLVIAGGMMMRTVLLCRAGSGKQELFEMIVNSYCNDT